MTTIRSGAGLVLLCAVSTACSAGGESSGLDASGGAGNSGGGNTGSVVGGGTGASSSGNGSGGIQIIPVEGGTSGGFGAHIENPDKIILQYLTLSCGQPCADVLAVGNGGNSPYTFEWEDGSHDAARKLCPTSTTRYTVHVADSPVRSGEFPRGSLTTTAEVTVEVPNCTTPGKDSGPPPPPSKELCLKNPSIEGTPAYNVGAGNFSASPWDACTVPLVFTSSPDILDATIQNVARAGTSLPAPSDGATYAGLLDNKNLVKDVLAQPLCEPIPAGERRSFRVDLARVPQLPPTLTPDANAGYIEVWGGSTACLEDQLLWTSPALDPSWRTYCVTLAPGQSVASISFRMRADYTVATASYGLIDHIVPVAACQ